MRVSYYYWTQVAFKFGLNLQILKESTKKPKNVQFNSVHSSIVGIITPRELEHVLMTDILFSVGKKKTDQSNNCCWAL